MKTTHTIIHGDSRRLKDITSASVHLVVTSPPYPMIAMWDEVFAAQSPAVGLALRNADGPAAFEAMHTILDEIWRECFRVLVPGGFLAINIGDAVRTIPGAPFRIYHNHARILRIAEMLGFVPLPDILWRKPTNAPNKFMGSGMLPAGAYVTYEHEYILNFRRPVPDGGVRQFAVDRPRSAYFWEERNVWFSDVWSEVRGSRQELGSKELRERSAAFPLEVPFRLINMFSGLSEVVLDPFAGTGTTSLAALAAGRSSIAIEYDEGLCSVIRSRLHPVQELAIDRTRRRLSDHREFVERRLNDGKVIKYKNVSLDMPVMTRQEQHLEIWEPVKVSIITSGHLNAEHQPARHPAHQGSLFQWAANTSPDTDSHDDGHDN